MKNLFYSQSDHVLFYIPGYLDNSMKALNQHATTFAKVAECKVEDVSTLLITKSSRYQNMQVFYITAFKPVPNAFILDEDWSMWKWIEN